MYLCKESKAIGSFRLESDDILLCGLFCFCVKCVDMEKKNRRGRRGPDKIQVFKVQKDMPLFEFLLETFADRSKTTVKSYLAHRQIAVNNTPTTKFDAPLHDPLPEEYFD